MIFKEMDYNGSGNSEVIYFEEFDDGTAVAILNVRGSHPCAYIQFKGIEELRDYEDLILYDEETGEYEGVHGGFTFLGTLSHHGLNGIWIGWDYAHCGDWTQSMNPSLDLLHHHAEKKWTTQEILDEALKALQFIRKGKYQIENDESVIEDKAH